MRVVVLGAGFAGLAAALRLRLAGADVTVLDPLARPGGKAALGERDFSSGPTVVTMPEVFRALCSRVGVPEPTLEAASPTTRYAYPDGRVFAPGAVRVDGLDGTLAQLDRVEREAYLRLLRASRAMFRDAAGTFLFAPPPTPLDLARYARAGGRRAAPHRTLAGYVRSGPYLTPFWLRFATYLGADPYRAPAVLHNIAWVELGHGVWHLRDTCRGVHGLAGFAERLAARAAEVGVRFEWGVRAEHLHVQRGRVVAAQTGAGVLTADAWVSALDTASTARLLGRGGPRAPRGVSGFALQLRLREDAGRAHHVLFPAEYAREWQDIRAGRLPSDPTLYLHLDGVRAFLLVNAPPRPDAVTDRDGYARFLLRRLQARFPLPVSSWRALGPGEYAQTGVGGALYGRAPQGLRGSLRPGWRHAGVGNLVQVGGTVHPGGGVPLSMLSGWNGAGALLGLPYDNLGRAMLTVDDDLLA